MGNTTKKNKIIVKHLLKKYLVEPGYISEVAMYDFIYFNMSEEMAKCFIGLENFKNLNANIKDIDMSITYAHDIGGIVKEDKYFIPRSIGYLKHYIN